MTADAHAGKHFPQPTAETRAYWEGCRQHRLLIQRCTVCGNVQFYPRSLCHRCLSDAIGWVESAGRGRITSFTVVRRPVSPAYAADTPYVVALVRLEEGPTLMSNIVECDIASLRIGQEVSVVFEDWSEEISIPKFRPVPVTA